MSRKPEPQERHQAHGWPVRSVRTTFHIYQDNITATIAVTASVFGAAPGSQRSVRAGIIQGWIAPKAQGAPAAFQAEQ